MNNKQCKKAHRIFYLGAGCWGVILWYLALLAKKNFGNFGFFGVGSILLGTVLILGGIVGIIYFSDFTTERKGVLV